MLKLRNQKMNSRSLVASFQRYFAEEVNKFHVFVFSFSSSPRNSKYGTIHYAWIFHKEVIPRKPSYGHVINKEAIKNGRTRRYVLSQL